MALDLTLLPFDAEHGTWGFAHTTLDLQRRELLFEEFLELETEPVPAEFLSFVCRDDAFEVWHYGNTQETPYGEPLECVRASKLLEYGEREGVMDNHKNRAAWAYLRQLPPDTKIALYWS